MRDWRMRTALRLSGRRALPARRFLAWDEFRDDFLLPPGKRAGALHRRLFCADYLRRRAASPAPSSVFPPAGTAEGFVRWLARLLPSLAEPALDEAARGAGDRALRAYAAELVEIREEYAAFLERAELREAGWDLPEPRLPSGSRFLVFLPELIEDYSRYDGALAGTAAVEKASGPDADRPRARRCASDREEIAAAMGEVARRLDAGEDAAGIAISVAGGDSRLGAWKDAAEEWGIPLDYSRGAPVASFPGGRLFGQIAACAPRMELAPMRELLLDPATPWREAGLAAELAAFGTERSCLSSYLEGGKEADPWERSLRAAGREERLRAFYAELKRELRAVSRASGLPELKTAYLGFQKTFIDAEGWDAEANLALSRALELLDRLAAVQAECPGMAPPSALPFLVSFLASDEARYVPSRRGSGVRLFPYRVACGIDAELHIVAGLDRDAATLRFRKLDGLREDFRVSLGLEDEDASAAFLGAYSGTGGASALSMAEEGASGFRAPHPFLALDDVPSAAASAAGDAVAGDAVASPVRAEEEWWAGIREELPRLLPAQIAAYAAHKALGARGEGLGAGYRALLAARKVLPEGGGAATLSPSAIDAFMECPLKWLWNNLIRLEPEGADDEILEPRDKGTYFHDAFRAIAERMIADGTALSPEAAERFAGEVAPTTNAAAERLRSRKGDLPSLLARSMAPKAAELIAGALRAEAAYYPGFKPVAAEKRLRKEWPERGLAVEGRVDLLLARGDQTVVIDYKASGGGISRKKHVPDAEGRIFQGQLLAYAILADAEEASYLCYDGSGLQVAVSVPGAGMVSREEAEGAYIAQAGRIAGDIMEGRIGRGDDEGVCGACEMRALCRRDFAAEALR